jgi:hypothetical protein
MFASNPNRLIWGVLLGAALLLAPACKPKTTYLYEVEDQQLSFPGGYKGKAKTDIEFISLVYSDLYGRPISQAVLTDLTDIYNANGDKNLATEMIVRGFLNDSQLAIPTNQQMRANPEAFVQECYQRFYLRKPTAYERWFLANEISKQTNLTPQLVYYAFVTSTEYKFY